MSERSRDHIEDFFRAAADNAHTQIPFREKDWDAMAAKLEAAGLVYVPLWKKLWFQITGMVMVAAIVFTYTNISNNTPSEVVTSIGDMYQNSSGPESNVSQIPDGAIPAAEQDDFDKDLKDPEDAGNLPIEGPRQGMRFETPSKRKVPPGSRVPVGRLPAKDEVPEGSEADQQLSGIETLPPELKWHSYALEDPQAIEDPGTISIIEQEPSRWSVIATLTPADFTTVGMDNYTAPGLKYGFQIAYRISERFTISTGAFIADKVYDADGEEYAPGQGFWTYGAVPETVNGECTVADIPINVRYELVRGDRHNIYVTSGLSSYIMLSEYYHYNYSYSNPNLVQSWSGKNQNRHFLAVTNLSVGYDKRLNSRFSLLVEPYIKVPVQDIGFGNVRLFSSGMMFSLKYNFLRRPRILLPQQSTTQHF